MNMNVVLFGILLVSFCSVNVANGNERCPKLMDFAVDTDLCNDERSCLGRCGQDTVPTESDYNHTWTCACDQHCMVYGECCPDFGTYCPDIFNTQANLLKPFKRFEITCMFGSYKVLSPKHSTRTIQAITVGFSTSSIAPDATTKTALQMLITPDVHMHVMDKKTGLVFETLEAFERILGDVSRGEYPLYFARMSRLPFEKTESIEDYVKRLLTNRSPVIRSDVPRPRPCEDGINAVKCESCSANGNIAYTSSVCFEVYNRNRANLSQHQPWKATGRINNYQLNGLASPGVLNSCALYHTEKQAQYTTDFDQTSFGTVAIRKLSANHLNTSTSIRFIGTPWQEFVCDNTSMFLDDCRITSCVYPTFMTDAGNTCITPRCIVVRLLLASDYTDQEQEDACLRVFEALKVHLGEEPDILLSGSRFCSFQVDTFSRIYKETFFNIITTVPASSSLALGQNFTEQLRQLRMPMSVTLSERVFRSLRGDYDGDGSDQYSISFSRSRSNCLRKSSYQVMVALGLPSIALLSLM